MYDEKKDRTAPGFGDRLTAWMRRYAVGSDLSLFGLLFAMLLSGALLGVIGCIIFGDRVDPERFRVAYLAERAFSGYPDGVSYLRAFVGWFFFYEKRFLLLLLFAFSLFAVYLCSAYLITEGFILGYAAVMLTRCGFSLLYLLFLGGMAFFSFLLVLFSVKAVRFSRDVRKRTEQKQPLFFMEGCVPLFGAFAIHSAACAAMLLLGSAISDSLLS